MQLYPLTITEGRRSSCERQCNLRVVESVGEEDTPSPCLPFFLSLSRYKAATIGVICRVVTMTYHPTTEGSPTSAILDDIRGGAVTRSGVKETCSTATCTQPLLNHNEFPIFSSFISFNLVQQIMPRVVCMSD